MRTCCMCHQEKPEADFAFRSIATGVRQDHCRVCHAAYRRQHYLDNREEYIQREVARITGYRLDNQLRLFEYLSTRVCVDCGESDVLVLEFDHRDPAKKKQAVTYIAARKSWKFVEAEIAKCDVRCANCHRRRTAVQQHWMKGSLVVVAGLPIPRVDVATTLDVTMTSMRTCTGCGVAQPLDQFSVKNKETGRRARRCHTGVATYGRNHYRRKTSEYLGRAKRNKRAYRARNRSLMTEYMQDKQCVDCGEHDPMVLEFDHRDGVDKENDVARLMATGSWALIASEIAKCDIRCANCHRRRTAERFGWLKRSLQLSAAKMA